jgi:hypothetical protein
MLYKLEPLLATTSLVRLLAAMITDKIASNIHSKGKSPLGVSGYNTQIHVSLDVLHHLMYHPCSLSQAESHIPVSFFL